MRIEPHHPMDSQGVANFLSFTYQSGIKTIQMRAGVRYESFFCREFSFFAMPSIGTLQQDMECLFVIFAVRSSLPWWERVRERG